MPLKIEMTGSGTIGDIDPSWSVGEYATPVALGETAGGTGQVTFSARSHPETALVINNEITSTHDRLGTIPGNARVVNVNGISTSISHDTPLAQFDAERYIPPLIDGSGWSALDIATQVVGAPRLTFGYAGRPNFFPDPGTQTTSPDLFSIEATAGNTVSSLVSGVSNWAWHYQHLSATFTSVTTENPEVGAIGVRPRISETEFVPPGEIWTLEFTFERSLGGRMGPPEFRDANVRVLARSHTHNFSTPDGARVRVWATFTVIETPPATARLVAPVLGADSGTDVAISDVILYPGEYAGNYGSAGVPERYPDA